MPEPVDSDTAKDDVEAEQPEARGRGPTPVQGPCQSSRPTKSAATRKALAKLAGFVAGAGSEAETPRC